MSLLKKQLSKKNSIGQSPTPPIDYNSLAWRFFLVFLEEQDPNATEDELLEFAKKDLNIEVNLLSTEIKESIPLTLITFMNMWPGWHFKSDYSEGKFTKEHYFDRFRKFMVHKMNCALRSQFNSALRAIESESLRVANSALDSASNRIQFSSYAISIQCPPSIVNNIVFTNTGDNVVMKQHLGINWQDLTTIELMNWPYIEVIFQSPDLTFVRTQATAYSRYLNIMPHQCHSYSNEVVENLVALNGMERQCYTNRFIKAYIDEYIDAFKSLKVVDFQKLNEIQVLLGQLVDDINYINVNSSIATNTKILFKLCPFPYIRHKKLVKDSSASDVGSRVGYCEIITPKIELVIHSFKPVQKNTPNVTFESTDKIRRSVWMDLNNHLPIISYKCTYCNIIYDSMDSKQKILEHLKKNHKMEQNVRCTVCKKQFDVLNLAQHRWKHKCESSADSSSNVTLHHPKNV